MANAFYDKGLEAFGTKKIDLANDDIIALLLDDAAGSQNLASDQFISDVPSGNILARSSPFSSKTTAAGVLDAADVLLASVPAVGTGKRIAISHSTGTDSTSRLIGLIDTGTNLPVTPNGGDINIAWSNGSSKIFKL